MAEARESTQQCAAHASMVSCIDTHIKSCSIKPALSVRDAQGSAELRSIIG